MQTNENKCRVLGFAIFCIVLPAAYAVIGHYIAASGIIYWPPKHASSFGLICCVLTFSIGLAKWWDIWIRETPKQGTNWIAINERAIFTVVGCGHTAAIIVMGLIFVGIVHNTEKAEKLNEYFEINNKLKLASFYPNQFPMEDDEWSALLAKEISLEQELFTIEIVYHYDWILLILLALWAGYTPSRTVHSSGLAIQR